MESDKLYLVSQREMDKIREVGAHAPPPLRNTVEHALDDAMRRVLDSVDIDAHERIKQYTALLQRYLSVVKQGEMETMPLKVSITPIEDSAATSPAVTASHQGGTPSDGEHFLKNIGPKNRANAQYILDLMKQSKDVVGWNSANELIYRGNVIMGSDVGRLLHNITTPQIRNDVKRPTGWVEMLRACADLKVPPARMANRYVRAKYESVKTSGDPIVASRPMPKSESKPATARKIRHYRKSVKKWGSHHQPKSDIDTEWEEWS